MPGTILIRGGRVIDPANGVDRVADVLLAAGKVAEVGKVRASADEVIEAAGLIVTPGLIDIHVHFREPGNQETETIASGAAAAAAGGFTTVAVMPNTDPPVDNEAMVEFVRTQSTRAGAANVRAIGTITRGRAGKDLAEMGQMARAGAVGFSDDGSWVRSAEVMRRAMEYARMLGKPVISHAEDPELSAGGVMHEGYLSAVLGLAGIPAAAEEVAVARDIILCRMTGARLHLAHVSTVGAVEAIRWAKSAGLSVTAEVTVHHLMLTDECVRSFDPVYKMSPPLRSAEHLAALREGLADGTIDCIVSDHAPHPLQEKDVEFDAAPFGVIGLESTLPIIITELIRPGVLSWPDAVARLTTNPARVLGLAKGTLSVGADADVTVIDPEVAWTIDAGAFKSRSRNCPFHGAKVTGRAVAAIVAGIRKA